MTRNIEGPAKDFMARGPSRCDFAKRAGMLGA
jgi:hypothetical protein